MWTSWVGQAIVPVHGVVFYRGMFLEPITPPLIHILGVFSHLLIHITSETDRTQKIDGCLLACPLKEK
jgi:hypothetical protein